MSLRNLTPSRNCQPSLTVTILESRRTKTAKDRTHSKTLRARGNRARSWERHGVRRQSAAATALSCAPDGNEQMKSCRTHESGVALRFPPQSKTRREVTGPGSRASVWSAVTSAPLWNGRNSRIVRRAFARAESDVERAALQALRVRQGLGITRARCSVFFTLKGNAWA
jgi:hypothetical protein